MKHSIWLVAVGSMAAFAHGADEATPPRTIEEIVITATYRDTKLMDTPQSISALSGDAIKDLGAKDISEIFQQIPALNVSTEGTGYTRYVIRGMSSQTGGAANHLTFSTVGVYLDDVPMSSAMGPARQLSSSFFDIERLEVLKGPQGTLFGEGSQGGTIRYLYKKPDASRFDWAANASTGAIAHSDEASHRLDAMVNVPLIEQTLAFRMSAFDTTTGGFIDNVSPHEEDYNEERSSGGRAAIRYTPTDELSINLSAFHVETETDGGSAATKPYEVTSGRLPGRPPRSEDDFDVFSLVLDWDMGWATFTSATSYADRDTFARAESSPSSAAAIDSFIALLVNLAVGFPLVPQDGQNLAGLDFEQVTSTKRFAQEIRLVSSGENRLRWTAGLFYKDSEDEIDLDVLLGLNPGREAFAPFYPARLSDPANAQDDTLTEYAAFGEVSYDLTDTLEVTLGGRVSRLEQEFGSIDDGQNDTPFSPKLVLSWRPSDDLLVYGSAATGFRPGNVNYAAAFNTRQFKPVLEAALASGDAAAAALAQAQIDLNASHVTFKGDEVINYELGFKTTFGDGRSQLQAAAYYMIWDDIILEIIDPRIIGATFYNDNSGKADIKGVELEYEAYLTDNLTMRLTGNALDTELKDDPYDGLDLYYAPHYSASLSFDYDLHLGERFVTTLHVDNAWVDSQFAATDLLGSTNQVKLPSYHKANARITLRDASDERWHVALFANNVTDEEILLNEVGGFRFYDRPRTIGLEFGWQG